MGNEQICLKLTKTSGHAAIPFCSKIFKTTYWIYRLSITEFSLTTSNYVLDYLMESAVRIEQI